jgi:hypothetical protein
VDNLLANQVKASNNSFCCTHEKKTLFAVFLACSLLFSTLKRKINSYFSSRCSEILLVNILLAS